MTASLKQNKIRTFLTAIVLLGLSSVSHAGFVPASWSDSIDFVPDILIPPGYTYEHDITDDGFRPLQDILLDYSLIVNLFDDQDLGLRRLEIAIVDVPGLLGDRVFWDLSGTEYGGWSLGGFLELNLLGALSVTIDSITGDFYLGDSHLTGYGFAKVPEPGTLALFGLGFVGIGMAKRRKLAPTA